MTRKELEQDLRRNGFLINGEDEFANLFIATKVLFNWNTSVIELRIDTAFDDDTSQVSIHLIHNDVKRLEFIPTSNGGKEIADWKPIAKKMAKDYLDELGKICTRLAEFDITGA